MTIGALFLDLTFLSLFIRVSPTPLPRVLYMVAAITGSKVLMLLALAPNDLDPARQFGVQTNCVIFLALVIGTSQALVLRFSKGFEVILVFVINVDLYLRITSHQKLF
jgi:hypothetical protein